MLFIICAPGLDRFAAAQQAPALTSLQPANPRETARHRFGFLYVNPSLSIDRLGYDSNVLNSPDDPKADFTASITPQATIWIPFQRRALLTTTADVSFVYYKTLESQRTVNGRINALGELYARRFMFSVEAGTATEFRQPEHRD